MFAFILGFAVFGIFLTFAYAMAVAADEEMPHPSQDEMDDAVDNDD